MEQTITLSIIKPGYDETHIHRLLSYANYHVMSVVNAILRLEEVDFHLHEAFEWFATSLHATYHSEKIKEILQTIAEDSADIEASCENDDDLPKTIAYDLGTNSEFHNNYSLVERMILIVAAARRMGYKFDFSWNL